VIELNTSFYADQHTEGDENKPARYCKNFKDLNLEVMTNEEQNIRKDS